MIGNDDESTIANSSNTDFIVSRPGGARNTHYLINTVKQQDLNYMIIRNHFYC